MSTAVQTQQQSLPAPARSLSCTPHLRNWPYHIHFADFQAICEGDAGDALRGFETKTNARIEELRRFDEVPADHLPHEDDLWLEVSVRDLARWTVSMWRKSKYAEILDDSGSLFELGFLRRRIVAYPGRYLLEPVETTIYLDAMGNQFLIVDDDAGNYIDESGQPCNAMDQGYTIVRRQYLYCIEAVNTALAKLEGKSPPESLPRWKSLQRVQRRGGTGEETTKSTSTPAHADTQTAGNQGCPDDESRTCDAANELCVNKHNINGDDLSSQFAEKSLSFVSLHNNSAILSSAWIAETFYDLLRYHLDVPDPNTIDEDQWMRDWELPRQWLFAETADIDCARAWEDIELNVCAELYGPTWRARKATTKFTRETLTLRHVVGWNKKTGDLNGHNWRTTKKALEAERWADYTRIAYRGPSLFDEDPAQSSSAQEASSEQSYAAGYSDQSVQSSAQVVDGTAQTLPDDEQAEHVIEVVAQVEDKTTQSDEQPVRTLGVIDAQSLAMAVQFAEQSMSSEEAVLGMDAETTCIVDAMIRREYPDIIIGARESDDCPGLFLIGIEIALDTWYDIVSLGDYLAPSPETQLAIADAEAYGKQRSAAEGNVYEDSQGPPGQGEVSEEGGDER